MQTKAGGAAGWAHIAVLDEMQTKVEGLQVEHT